MVSDAGLMLRDSCFEWSCSFACVGQATWTFEHVNEIASVTCYDSLDVEGYPSTGVTKGICFMSEVALWAIATFVITVGNGL